MVVWLLLKNTTFSDTKRLSSFLFLSIPHQLHLLWTYFVFWQSFWNEDKLSKTSSVLHFVYILSGLFPHPTPPHPTYPTHHPLFFYWSIHTSPWVVWTRQDNESYSILLLRVLNIFSMCFTFFTDPNIYIYNYISIFFWRHSYVNL